MASNIVQITNEIYQVGGPELTAPEDAAIYLVRFDNHAALIDAGCGRATNRLLENIAAAGTDPKDVEYLLITHCHFDHTGGARSLRDRLGCAVVMHALDARFLEVGDNEVTAATWYGARLQPCTFDRRFTGEDENISLGERTIRAVHIPGHSPGSVAYLTSSSGLKILFAQDVHGPLHPRLLSNAEDYLASLQRLIDLDADILCEGHYGIYKGKRISLGLSDPSCANANDELRNSCSFQTLAIAASTLPARCLGLPSVQNCPEYLVPAASAQ